MNNKEIFEKLLCDYKKQKKNKEQKEKERNEAFGAWLVYVGENGDGSEIATDLGKKHDKAISDLKESRENYNFLAHERLRYYILLNDN